MDAYINQDGTFTWYDITPSEFGVIKAALYHARTFFDLCDGDTEAAGLSHFGVIFTERDVQAVSDILLLMDNYEPCARLK